MRISKMITKEKCFDLLSNSLNLFFKEMYEDQLREFVSGYWAYRVNRGPVRVKFQQARRA